MRPYGQSHPERREDKDGSEGTTKPRKGGKRGLPEGGSNVGERDNDEIEVGHSKIPTLAG